MIYFTIIFEFFWDLIKALAKTVTSTSFRLNRFDMEQRIVLGGLWLLIAYFPMQLIALSLWFLLPIAIIFYLILEKDNSYIMDVVLFVLLSLGTFLVNMLIIFAIMAGNDFDYKEDVEIQVYKDITINLNNDNLFIIEDENGTVVYESTSNKEMLPIFNYWCDDVQITTVRKESKNIISSVWYLTDTTLSCYEGD